jgi:peptidoglycan/LPS O-acetylase OafA/YrhL
MSAAITTTPSRDAGAEAGRLLTAGRIVAAAVAVPTFLYLFGEDRFSGDNAFLVPDLVLCALLLAGAVLPARQAIPTLTLAYPLAAGVIGTAVADRVVDDEFNGLTVLVAVVCLVMAVLFTFRRQGPS